MVEKQKYVGRMQWPIGNAWKKIIGLELSYIISDSDDNIATEANDSTENKDNHNDNDNTNKTLKYTNTQALSLPQTDVDGILLLNW